MDNFKRACSKSYGKMYNKKCPCCNWTLRKKKKLYIRMIKKRAKAILKSDLREIAKEIKC